MLHNINKYKDIDENLQYEIIKNRQTEDKRDQNMKMLTNIHKVPT